ncbi:hypothetical protein N1851_006217 [Merluccius polli]|uniref:Uncharacterized protein n=1 Tax=Merluccius polli TaxID=89951 RepID=A0AA47N4K2_MERPO|nr:hypothetical protein N1851_006217 [Merluccius polli]
MSFLYRVAGLSLRDRVRSSEIRRELGVEPLLLCVERSQLRWFGHLIRMPPGHLPLEVFRACPTGRRPRGRPRTRWRDYICLGVPQEELENVAGEKGAWSSLLSLLPPRPGPDNRVAAQHLLIHDRYTVKTSGSRLRPRRLDPFYVHEVHYSCWCSRATLCPASGGVLMLLPRPLGEHLSPRTPRSWSREAAGDRGADTPVKMQVLHGGDTAECYRDYHLTLGSTKRNNQHLTRDHTSPPVLATLR